MLAPHVLNAISASKSEAEARWWLHDALQARLCANRAFAEALILWHAERQLVSSFLTHWRAWYSLHDERVHLLAPLKQLYPVSHSARKHGYDLTSVDFLNQSFTLLSSPPGALPRHWPDEWAQEQRLITPVSHTTAPWATAPLRDLYRRLPDPGPDTLRDHLGGQPLDEHSALMRYFSHLHLPTWPLPGFEHLEIWEQPPHVLVYLALHPGEDMPLTEVADEFPQHPFSALLAAQGWQVQTAPHSAFPNTFSALLISPPHFRDAWYWHD